MRGCHTRPMSSTDTTAEGPMQSKNAPGVDAGLRLFPSCDPRGVLTRALALDAPPWSTRPDAVVFGWMLALPPGVNSEAAANAVLACVAADKRESWSEAQLALLEALRAVADGRSRNPVQPRRKRR